MRPACFFLLLIFLLVKTNVVSAQSADGYKDFILNGKNVILLTKAGKLKFIDVVSQEPGLLVETDAPILALSADTQGNIVVGDKNQLIKRYDYKQKTWQPLTSYSDKLINIVFNSQNQCFLITNKGIVDAMNHAVYFPDSSLSKNNQIRYKNDWFWQPVCFIDHQDQLWLGFDHGEWGGDVFAFDTRNRIFSTLQTDSLEMTLNPVAGFCEDPQNVYMSGGLSHIVLTHGSIARFTNGVATPVLQSKDRETPVEEVIDDPKTSKKQRRIFTTWRGGHRIGPCAYNPANKCLYFYSQNGFFKSRLDTDLSDINQWESVLKPTLKWTGGSRNAVGPSMNVLKMKFTADGTLLFLTEHEGLGIYDGKELRFIR